MDPGSWPRQGLRMTRRDALGAVSLAGGFVAAGCSGRTGASRQVPWSELRREVVGDVVLREDTRYESDRTAPIWNAIKPVRFPRAIVHVASVEDVQSSVRFARRHGLKVSVRGGGHNWNGSPLRQDALLLDLSRLNDVEINAAGQTARIQPAVTNRDLSRLLSARGLAFPVGHCPTVTLSGYLLGGGFGWNAGDWGVACFNVTAMDIITADGELVTASEQHVPELFWAARGAGSGFFGVVTRYHLKLFPLPGNIEQSTLVYPLERARNVASWLSATAPELRRNVECSLIYAQSPPPLAARSEKACVVSAVAFAGSKKEAEEALRPVAACPVADCLMKDLDVPTTFDSLFDDMDRQLPHGRRYAVDTFWMEGDAVTLLDRAAGHFAKSPSPDSMMLALVLPPPPAGAPPMPQAAFSMMGPLYLGCYAGWNDPEKDAENGRWVIETGELVRAETIGHYIGEVNLTLDESRATRSFARPNWDRLEALRARFDPEGVFHSYLEAARK